VLVGEGLGWVVGVLVGGVVAVAAGVEETAAVTAVFSALAAGLQAARPNRKRNKSARFTMIPCSVRFPAREFSMIGNGRRCAGANSQEAESVSASKRLADAFWLSVR